MVDVTGGPTFTTARVMVTIARSQASAVMSVGIRKTTTFDEKCTRPRRRCADSSVMELDGGRDPGLRLMPCGCMGVEWTVCRRDR